MTNLFRAYTWRMKMCYWIVKLWRLLVEKDICKRMFSVSTNYWLVWRINIQNKEVKLDRKGKRCSLKVSGMSVFKTLTIHMVNTWRRRSHYLCHEFAQNVVLFVTFKKIPLFSLRTNKQNITYCKFFLNIFLIFLYGISNPQKL